MTEAERRALRGLVARLLGADARVDLAALPLPLVRRHFLAPLAYRLGATLLRHDYIASALQAERRAQALAEAIAALGAAAVPVILLKGVAYAGTLYPDPAERPMSDIDLLVPADAFARARAALLRLGYWHAGGSAQLSVTRHAITLKRRDGAIDLHRHMLHAGRSRIDLAAIWRAAVPSHIPGARRLAPLHEYLIHVAHIGRHEGNVPLVNYVDAARLRAAVPDLAVLRTTARAWWISRVTDAVDAALDALADADRREPPGWRFPSADELARGGLSPTWRRVRRKLVLVDDVRALAGFAVSVLHARMAPRWRG